MATLLTCGLPDSDQVFTIMLDGVADATLTVDYVLKQLLTWDLSLLRFIDVPAKDGQPARGPRSGLCIEASRYVNAINNDQWRRQVVLKKGQIWGSRTVYRAWTE